MITFVWMRKIAQKVVMMPHAHRWVLVMAFTFTIWNFSVFSCFGSTMLNQLHQAKLQMSGTVNKTALSTTDNASLSSSPSSFLTYLYQSRLKQTDWFAQQCYVLRFIMMDNQTSVFPYLQVPVLEEEKPEQFHLPIIHSSNNIIVGNNKGNDHDDRDDDDTSAGRTRIAVMHLWRTSVDEENPTWKIPPFFQYWLASAIANAPIADFLIFVPDNTTKMLLQQYLPTSSSLQSSNVKFHVVGNLETAFDQRIGDVLEKAPDSFSGPNLGKLRPMMGYVFEKYLTTPTEYYSHWAWADMDLILGNLTKFLLRPIMEGYKVISMSSVEEHLENKTTFWTSHMCTLNTRLAGQLTAIVNTNEARKFFFQDSFRSNLPYQYDEVQFPTLLVKLQVRVAHVFAQVTDQNGHLDGYHFDWSHGGLFKLEHGAGCYRYEVGLVHMMRGKKLVRNRRKQQQHAQQNNHSLEQIIFPGPFAWDNLSGFMMKFPVEESSPWEPYYNMPSSSKMSSIPCAT